MNTLARVGASFLAAFLSAALPSEGRASDVTWVGCDSWAPGLADALAAEFGQRSSLVIVTEGGNSTRGIREVAAGSADAGCSLRHKVPSQEERNAKLHIIGWEALVVVAHASNPVDRITLRDMQAVLEGKITHWSALGGGDREIKLFLRSDPTAGIDLLLREILFKDADTELAAGAKRLSTTAEIEAAVAGDPDAIAVTSYGRLQGLSTKPLRLGTAVPSYETIASGSYPLVLPFYFVVPRRHGDTTKALVAFLKGQDGQEIIKTRGSVNMADGRDLLARYQRSIAEARKKGAK